MLIFDIFRKIEDEARQLPSQTPSLSVVNRLNGFLMDVATNTCGMDAYMNAQDVFDWSDSTGVNFSNFLNIFIIWRGEGLYFLLFS